MVESSREMVSRIFKELKEGEYIDVEINVLLSINLYQVVGNFLLF